MHIQHRNTQHRHNIHIHTTCSSVKTNTTHAHTNTHINTPWTHNLSKISKPPPGPGPMFQFVLHGEDLFSMGVYQAEQNCSREWHESRFAVKRDARGVVARNKLTRFVWSVQWQQESSVSEAERCFQNQPSKSTIFVENSIGFHGKMRWTIKGYPHRRRIGKRIDGTNSSIHPRIEP